MIGIVCVYLYLAIIEAFQFPNPLGFIEIDHFTT